MNILDILNIGRVVIFGYLGVNWSVEVDNR